MTADTDTLRKLAEAATNIEKTIAKWSIRQIAEHIAEFEASDTALRAKVKRLEDVLRPIEEAPKDGSEVLGFGSYVYEGDTSPTNYCSIAHWSGDEAWPWENHEGKHPPEFFTHFIPLASLPEPKE